MSTSSANTSAYDSDDSEESTGLDKPLLKAAKDGHYREVVRLLWNGAKVNTTDIEDSTPLILAAEEGHAKIVGWLLKHKARTDKEDMEGYTALHRAAQKGHISVIAKLLKAGVNIDITGDEGKTPLHVAAEEDQDVVVRYLLDHGADINAFTFETELTPLFLAASMSARTAVNTLLSRGAKITSDWETAVHFAAETGCPILINDFLEAGADLNARDGTGCVPLHGAMYYKTAETLISLGAIVNVQDNDGNTPLHKVSENMPGMNERTVAVLLANGADIHIKNNKGQTALHIASMCGCMEIVTLLLENGADLHCKDNEGQTPLHEALESQSYWRAHSKVPLSVYIKQYMVMMRHVNMYLCKDLLKEIEDQKLDEACLEELERLKVTRIGSSNVTLYKFLSKSVHQLVVTLRNESLQEYFKSGSYKTEFPNFAVLISNLFYLGIRRKNLVDKVLCNCGAVFDGLIEDCVLEILSYFSNDELINFADSFTIGLCI